jgi:hypothetical protein
LNHPLTRTKLLSILLLLCPVFLTAQAHNKPYVTAYYQLNAAYRIATQQDQYYKASYGGVFRSDSPKYGYEIGLNLSFPVFGYCNLNMGLAFANKGFISKTEDHEYLLYDPGHISKVIIDKPYVLEYQTRYNFYYFDVPLMLDCFMIDEKGLQLSFMIGPVFNFTSSASCVNTLHYQDGYDEKLSKEKISTAYLSSIEISGSAALRFNIFFSENLGINITPRISSMITEWYSDRYGIYRLFDMGVQFGIFYRFERIVNREL